MTPPTEPLPLERAAPAPSLLRDTLAAFGDRRFALFAAIAFVFPLSMGMLVTVTPLYATARGLGESYIGLVLGANSILVAALALPVATRIEAQGPFRLLGAAAAIIAAALGCFALIPGAAAALLIGTVVYSFGEVVFSSAVPAGVARLAPAGRRGAYQGAWTLVASLSLGSALALSGAISLARLRGAHGCGGGRTALPAPALRAGRLVARVEARRVPMLQQVLGEELAAAACRIEGDLPAEVRRRAVALEELVHELLAQARPLAARLADIHELIVVPELEYSRRIGRGYH